jgi:Na+-driven multidrug efflux pump
MSAVLVIFGRAFLFLFTRDAEVVEAGLTRLRVMGCSYAFSALMDCTIAASRGLGRSAVPTVIVILGSCVFRVIWVFTVFAHFHTILSLYLLYIFSWTITGIAELCYFIYCYRDKMRRLQS